MGFVVAVRSLPKLCLKPPSGVGPSRKLDNHAYGRCLGCARPSERSARARLRLEGATAALGTPRVRGAPLLRSSPADVASSAAWLVCPSCATGHESLPGLRSVCMWMRELSQARV